MNFLKILVIIAGIAIQVSTAFGEESFSNDDASRYQKAASLIVERATDYYKANGWDFSPVDVSTLPIEPDVLAVWRIPEVWVGRYDKPVVIELERSSGKLCSFINVILENKKRTLFDVAPPKKWSERQAKDMATAFIVAILGSMPSNVRPEPSIRFALGREAPKYTAGTWYVIFGRVDPQGHSFQRDSIGVSIRDGDGPSALHVNLWSIYKDTNIEPIPREQALKVAAEGAKKVLAWAPARDWFGNSSLAGETQAELRVVNPNHLWERPSIEASGSSLDLNARLAWVITYKRTENAVTPDAVKPAAGQLEIWVDAENTQLLGGDFK